MLIVPGLYPSSGDSVILQAFEENDHNVTLRD